MLLTHGAEKKNRADAEWERPDNTPVSEGHTHGDMANVWLGVAGGEEVQSDKGPASLQKCAYEKLWPWRGEGGGTNVGAGGSPTERRTEWPVGQQPNKRSSVGPLVRATDAEQNAILFGDVVILSRERTHARARN